VQAGDGPATGEKWTFEIKFDGYRCIAAKRGSAVTLLSRNEKVLNERFPTVVDTLASLESDFVLDGELVAIDPQGMPSFQLLQNNPVARASGLLLRLRPAQPGGRVFGERGD
jgi:bifunctional non-homologous end joining protein LigD